MSQKNVRIDFMKKQAMQSKKSTFRATHKICKEIPKMILTNPKNFPKSKKKPKKDPPKSKNAIKSGQIDFFLFFDPPKYANCDSKTFFKF